MYRTLKRKSFLCPPVLPKIIVAAYTTFSAFTVAFVLE
jgi:hypothetical protein